MYTLTEKILKKRQWDLYFLKLCEVIAEKSCDPSTKVGCVIVGPDHEIRSTGYNGMPRGVEPNNIRLERPMKYHFMEHAERNAIFNAARSGISLKDCTAYCSCAPKENGGSGVCVECARALIQSGIIRIVLWNITDKNEAKGTWRESVKYAYEMLVEAKISVVRISDVK